MQFSSFSRPVKEKPLH